MEIPLKLLAVEDNLIDRMAMEKAFASMPGTMDLTDSVANAHKFLRSKIYDAVLIDLALKDGSARDIIPAVHPTTAFLIITGNGDEQVAVEMMKQNASDYIVKDTHGHYLNNLKQSVAQAIEKKRLENLLSAKKLEIERSNKALREFAYIASHDLQSPLTNIQMASELLMKNNNPELLNIINQSAHRLKSLIRNLLDMSQIESKSAQRETIHLANVINNLRSDLTLNLQEREVAFNLSLNTWLLANPLQMYQLFLNLITNSLNYNEPSRPLTITISDNFSDDSPLFVDKSKSFEIIYQDNGCGFPPTISDHIFDPFFRGNHQHRGTGLGLTICQRIVEAHHGKIFAEGSQNNGAVFHIVFPLTIVVSK